jgi:hypothetical protein
MDRRTKDRVELQLKCCVNAGRITAVSARALTENVSRTGILIRWNAETPLPAVDSKFILDVELPENSEFGQRIMRCRVSVVRALPAMDRYPEVALKIHSMRFAKTKPIVDAAPWSPYDLQNMPVTSRQAN